MRTSFLLLFVVASSIGCLHVHERNVAYERAQSDLGCSEVELHDVPGNGFVANGCGRSEQLTCTTSTNNNGLWRERETACFTSGVAEDAPPEPAIAVVAKPKKAGPPIDALKLVLQSIPHADCGTGGEGAIRITFAPNGTASDVVVVSGDYDDATKSCIVSRYMSARVSPFEGDARTFGWKIRLPERPV